MNLKVGLAILACCLSGCVTVLRGRQTVKFTSDPPGARVQMGRKSGITPCELLISRSRDPVMVKFSKDGYESCWEEVSSSDTINGNNIAWTPLFFVDGLLIIPGLVDLCSGCIWDYPWEMHAILPAKGTGTSLLEVTR